MLEIKKAYREKALKLHPDLNSGDKKRESEFSACSEAYETLKDEVKRREYNQQISYQKTSTHKGDFVYDDDFDDYADMDPQDYEEILFEFDEDYFQEGFRQKKKKKASSAKPSIIRQKIKVDFMKAALGGRIEFTYVDNSKFNCDDFMIIPAGTKDGDILRKKSDRTLIILAVQILQHDIFFRDGLDIHVEVSVPLSFALLGGALAVPTIHGMHNIQLNPGIRPGHVHTLKYHGISIKENLQRGHQYIHLELEFPKKLSNKQKELLQKFREEETPVSLSSFKRPNLQSSKKPKKSKRSFEDSFFRYF